MGRFIHDIYDEGERRGTRSFPSYRVRRDNPQILRSELDALPLGARICCCCKIGDYSRRTSGILLERQEEFFVMLPDDERSSPVRHSYSYSDHGMQSYAVDGYDEMWNPSNWVEIESCIPVDISELPKAKKKKKKKKRKRHVISEADIDWREAGL